MLSKALILASALTGAATASAALEARDTCTFQVSSDPGDTCQSFSDFWGLTVAQLVAWNTGVSCASGSTTLPVATYCIESDVVATTPPPPPATTSSSSSVTPPKTTTTAKQPTTTTAPANPSAPSPTQANVISSCTSWYQVKSGDGCQAIVDSYGTFSLANFYTWNPDVGNSCAGLWLGYYVCVGTGATPTQKPAGPTTTAAPANAPSPVQTGIIQSCQKYYTVKSGDTCGSIVAKYGTFSVPDFESWNPAVGKDCAALWIGYNVCVGIPGTPANAPAPAPTPAGPQPQQAGITSKCNSWYQVVSGDGCQAIATKKNISLANFYSWNPAVGSSCASLWLGYYVCVGSA